MQSVVSALIEVAATLASLNLVFLGIIFSAFQQHHQGHDDATPRRYRALAITSLGSFIVGVTTVAVGAIALLAPAVTPLVPVLVVLFFAQLVALVALAVRSARAIP